MHVEMVLQETATEVRMVEEKIQTWLVGQIARVNGCSGSSIDINEPFASYGLDSVAAAVLSGELATWLRIELPPTITWDYPNVKLLAQYLVNTVGPVEVTVLAHP